LSLLKNRIKNQNENQSNIVRIPNNELARRQAITDRKVGKRERLIQTYIVVFGLLVAYGQDPSLQKYTMGWFLGFLFFSMTYYSIISTRFHSIFNLPPLVAFQHVLFVNIFAFIACADMTFAFLTMYYKLVSEYFLIEFVGYFIILISVLSWPLFIRRSMFSHNT
jgi:hypothetical protein